MSKLMMRILLTVVIVTMLTGCDMLGDLGIGGGKAPVEDMLPELSGYTVVEGEVLTDYIGTVSGGAALLVGHPELAAAIAYMASPDASYVTGEVMHCSGGGTGLK